jgi:hypothetical protein
MWCSPIGFSSRGGSGVFIFLARMKLIQNAAVRSLHSFIATQVWFIVNTFVERPAQAWAGLGFLALGVPVYYFWRKSGKKH